jgi:hypothetical protein
MVGYPLLVFPIRLVIVDDSHFDPALDGYMKYFTLPSGAAETSLLVVAEHYRITDFQLTDIGPLHDDAPVCYLCPAGRISPVEPISSFDFLPHRDLVIDDSGAMSRESLFEVYLRRDPDENISSRILRDREEIPPFGGIGSVDTFTRQEKVETSVFLPTTNCNVDYTVSITEIPQKSHTYSGTSDGRDETTRDKDSRVSQEVIF